MVSPIAVPPGEHVPTADQRLIRFNVPWAHFEPELALRGDAPVPRIEVIWTSGGIDKLEICRRLEVGEAHSATLRPA